MITTRDYYIMCHCLLLAPGAELGDRVGGGDDKTFRDRIRLAREIANLLGETEKKEILLACAHAEVRYAQE